MTKAIRRRITPGRLAWLRCLREHSIAGRPRGNVGYHCMRLGWTEWCHMLPDGERIGTTALRVRYPDGNPDGFWDGVKTIGEQLTAAGLEALIEHERQQDAPHAQASSASKGCPASRPQGEATPPLSVWTDGKRALG